MFRLATKKLFSPSCIRCFSEGNVPFVKDWRTLLDSEIVSDVKNITQESSDVIIEKGIDQGLKAMEMIVNKQKTTNGYVSCTGVTVKIGLLNIHFAPVDLKKK